MGQITITTTSEQDALISPACGAKLRLIGNASSAEVKADLINYIQGYVRRYQNKQATNAVVPMSDPN